MVDRLNCLYGCLRSPPEATCSCVAPEGLRSSPPVAATGVAEDDAGDGGGLARSRPRPQRGARRLWRLAPNGEAYSPARSERRPHWAGAESRRAGRGGESYSRDACIAPGRRQALAPGGSPPGRRQAPSAAGRDTEHGQNLRSYTPAVFKKAPPIEGAARVGH